MESSPRSRDHAPPEPWLRRLSETGWTRILLGLAFLAYLPSLGYDLVYDDNQQILLNPWLSSWRYAAKLLTQDVWAGLSNNPATHNAANYYRPLFMLWLLAWNRLSGGVPGFFHLANLLLHLVAVLLVLEITRKLTGDTLLALLTGLLFALHPVHIEAVVWISSAPELLYSTLVLGSIWMYLQREEDGARRWSVLSVALFALALFAKETAIVLLAVIPSYAFCFADGTRLRRLTAGMREVLPYGVVAAAYLLIRVRVLHGFSESPLTSASEAVLGFWIRFAWYARQLVWPVHMSPDYAPIATGQIALWVRVTTLVLCSAIAAWTAWKLRRSRMAVLAGTLSLAALSPVLLESFSGLHDRYLYLPSFAFCVAVAWTITQLGRLQTPAARGAQAAIVGVVAVLCMATIAREERIWDNDLSLFERAVEVHRSAENLAQISAIYGDRGEQAKQLATLRSALGEFPRSHTLWDSLGFYYQAQSHPGDAEEAFRRAAELAPTAMARSHDECALGMMAFESGKLAEAEPELRAGLGGDSRNQQCAATLALLLERTQRRDEARGLRARNP